MKNNSAGDDFVSLRIAAIAAILAGAAWICWAVVNGATGGGLDAGVPAIGLRLAKFGQLLTIGWNLLLIPAALVLWKRLQNQKPNLILLYTVGGVLSLSFWTLGAAARVNSPVLEVTYLLLSSVWWLGIGFALRVNYKVFGTFTVIVGAFAMLDAALSFFEPLPFYIYVLAAPKLPLAIIWDFWLGFFLLKSFNTEPAENTSLSD
ncbi:MAG TPA: hypothetical protein VGC97_18865 [Pyrinomonadaceae bacterium]|jgi:hypothetical protein